jgi:hypothetical protein
MLINLFLQCYSQETESEINSWSEQIKENPRMLHSPYAIKPIRQRKLATLLYPTKEK